ncbi:MAG: PilZ domain-containing protein [Candidatus Omnitrophota bacterium]|nr:PilZ domain-containing protein [Candidatus Omnitrophota bacterium]
MEDKRRNIRWQINKDAKMDLLGGEPEQLNCAIKDICVRGVRVCVNRKLPQEATININLDLCVDVSLRDVEAKVVWRQASEEANAYGLSFERIREMDKTKIYDFVHRNFPKEIRKGWWQGQE